MHLLTDQGCHPIGYADDILFIVRRMHLDALMGVMQQTLKVVDTWCRTTRLSVNPGNTEVVIFAWRYKWTTTRTLKVKGQRLEIFKHANYLGVILDKKLHWKDHFDNKCNKFKATLWLCRRAIGSNCGLETRHTAVDLYSDSATQTNLCIGSLAEQSQAEVGYGQFGKAQRADS